MSNKTEESEIPTPKSDDFNLGINILSFFLRKNQSVFETENQNSDDTFILEILKIANKKKIDEGGRLFG